MIYMKISILFVGGMLHEDYASKTCKTSYICRFGSVSSTETVIK